MGIAVNLVTYLGGTMHLPSATSANIVTDFMGTSFFLCLLGGFLADSFLGRYWTIAIFASIQTVVSVTLLIVYSSKTHYFNVLRVAYSLCMTYKTGDWFVSNINLTSTIASTSLPC